MLEQVACMPAAYQPHKPGNGDPKAGNGSKGWQTQSGGQTVERPQSQNASLLIEILYCN